MVEPHTQPPEGFDSPKCDPVDLDTAIEWRDKIKYLTMQCGYGTAKGTTILLAMLEHMTETIDDCHGLNDDVPSKEDILSAKADNELHRLRDEGKI